MDVYIQDVAAPFLEIVNFGKVALKSSVWIVTVSSENSVWNKLSADEEKAVIRSI